MVRDTALKKLTSIVTYIPKKITEAAVWSWESSISYHTFFSEQVKQPTWKKDALVTTAAQVGVVNWLQMVPPLISQFSDATLENNWYLMTAFSLVLSYPYAVFRDWRAEKRKRTKEHLSQTVAGKAFYEGFPLGAWHLGESVFRFGYLFGEKDLSQLALNGGLFTMFGLVVGNIYGGAIDVARYVTGINSFDDGVRPVSIKAYDAIVEKLDDLKERVPLFPLSKTPFSLKTKESLLYATSVAFVLGSYAVIKSRQDPSTTMNEPLPVHHELFLPEKTTSQTSHSKTYNYLSE